MDRTLLGYLPPLLREVTEFRAINRANEPEIALAWEALEQVLGDQFLDTAGAQGVARWERELRVRPKDTDTLELRKARVKALWNVETPYTLPWLRNWLENACGGEALVEDYRLLVKTGAEALGILPDVKALVRRVVPANMVYGFLVWYEAAAAVQMAFVSHRVDFHVGTDVFGVQIIRLDGTRRLDGSWALGTEWARGAKFPKMSLRWGTGRIMRLHKIVSTRSRSFYLPGIRTRDGLRAGEEAAPSHAYRMAISAGAEAGASLSGELTADSMWRLDGSYRLDGSRRLNADIITTKL